MAKTIDADAHVIETERTWEFIPDEDARFRPRVLRPKEDGTGEEYWFLEGRAWRRNVNASDVFPTAAREASDIAARIAHMDEIGVDIHVLYPTIFLRPVTHHADTDAALARGYNRWLADIWKQAPERLRWVLVPPLQSIPDAIEELRFGKEHGACGIFMRGFEGDHRLSDPYLFPMYEEAEKLDLPICVHAATGSFAHLDMVDRDVGLTPFKLPAVGGFHDLILQKTPQRFPNLRWAFVETSASWVPYALNDLKIRYRRFDRAWPGGAAILKEHNMWVAVQTEDDLPYILNQVGDDQLVIGTDYGHNDTATEILALRNLKESGVIPDASADKILSDNAARLYGL